MEAGKIDKSRLAGWRRPHLLGGAVILLVLVGLLASAFWKRRGENGPSASSEDPRLTYPTPYRNVRPEVQYVGDQLCAGCHAKEAQSYVHHPMGQSFAPLSRASSPESYDPGVRHSFEQSDFRFEVVNRGERTFHRETRQTVERQPLFGVEAEVQFVLGSGTRGRSYLINRDGYLFQSPLSWYSQKKSWDLSPGYDRANLHFERPIEAACLFCHCNDATPVPDTVNRYRQPLFQGHAIGCERCHGPGELHVQAVEKGENLAHTIVNPRQLEPSLREAVCQQCHLQGIERTLRRGRQPFDYRPGLPLYLFWSVFVQQSEEREGQKAVGQVEQLGESRCYKGSQGQLGCISCHDPHVSPAPAAKAAYYRSRCLSCHQKSGCTLPVAVRQEKNGDNCSSCHLPRINSSDVAHVALSDHRIPRRADGPPRTGEPRPLAPRVSPLLLFHQDQVALDEQEVARDLGVALSALAWNNGPAGKGPFARKALPLLERTLATWPDDVPGWEAKGSVLYLQNQPEEALAAFEKALALTPERERSLAGAALSAERLRRTDLAIAYWQRILAVNPWSSQARAHLAPLLGQRQDWSKAAEECEAVLRLNPTAIETRMFLAYCHLKKGDKAQARAEFDKVMALKPSDREMLRRWFEEQSGLQGHE
jgi:predicted CXXCH cytochrome family protein